MTIGERSGSGNTGPRLTVAAQLTAILSAIITTATAVTLVVQRSPVAGLSLMLTLAVGQVLAIHLFLDGRRLSG